MISQSILSIIFFTILISRVFAAEEIPFLQDEYDSSKWPTAHLKLSQAATLKDIFDSGLRPYRFPSLETSTLEAKHIKLVIHLSSGKVLPEVQTEWMNIKVFDDGELSQIESATPQLSIEQARMEMLQWLPFGTRTKEDLDNYLNAVKADPLDFDDPYRGLPDGCGIGWKEPKWAEQGGGAHCGIGFRKTFSQEHPLRLYFSFSWSSNRSLKNAKSYRIPIPPPPGYEHVSMKAPEKFGPDSGTDINRSKGISIGATLPVKDKQKLREVSNKTRPEKKTAGTKPSKFSWLWILLAAIGTLIARYFLKRRIS